MKNYQLLAWDTEVLGIAVAKILPEKLSLTALSAILEELKKQNVKLVYWASNSQDNASQQAAKQCSGFLADQKITYFIDFNKADIHPVKDDCIEEYQASLPNAELLNLALESGLYSRFKMDSNISQAQFEKIYKLWIASSTKKVNAKKVLVIRKDEKIVGMITLGEKNNRGDIGLLAVDQNSRGEKFGVRLVQAAQQWCIKQGYQQGQVVTQMKNTPACKLYEKCGYHIEKIENFYHFWL